MDSERSNWLYFQINNKMIQEYSEEWLYNYNNTHTKLKSQICISHIQTCISILIVNVQTGGKFTCGLRGDGYFS